MEDDRAFRIWQERLRGDMAEWETVQRDSGALLRGAPLAEAERWLAERPDDVGSAERHFIQASRALRDRSVRRLRMTVGALTLLLVVAVSLGGLALWLFDRADEQRRLAQSRELVTRANLLVESQPDVAMLLAAAAYRIAATTEAVETLTSMASQRRHVDRLLATGAEANSEIVFNPQDPTMVALASANSVTLWDIKKNVLLKRHEAQNPSSLTFSPDGRILAFLQEEEQEELTVRMWFHAQGRVEKIPHPIGFDESPGNLVFSPGGRVLGACVGQSIQLWTMESPFTPPRSIPLGQHFGYLRCAFGFTAGGRGIAYVDGAEIVTWSIAEGKVTARKPPPQTPSPYATSSGQKLTYFAVAPDGRTALYGDQNGILSWWDVEQQAQLPGMKFSRTSFGYPVLFTPDSRFALIKGQDADLLVDVTRRIGLAAYGSIIYSSALSPDGHLIAAIDGGSVVSLAETGVREGIPVSAIHVAIQPDKEHVTTVSGIGEVAIYALGESEPNIAIPAGSSELSSQIIGDREIDALSPDGLYYAVTGDLPHRIGIWDLSSSPVSEMFFKGHRGEVLQLSFDASSEFLASADMAEVIVWSVKNHTVVSRIPLPKGYAAASLQIGPGGRYIAMSSASGKGLLWDTESPGLTSTTLPVDWVTSLAFSPDGRWLSIGSQNEIKLWDLHAEKIDSNRIPIPISRRARFSPDGTFLAIQQEYSGELTVWDLRELSDRRKGCHILLRLDKFIYLHTRQRAARYGRRRRFHKPLRCLVGFSAYLPHHG